MSRRLVITLLTTLVVAQPCALSYDPLAEANSLYRQKNYAAAAAQYIEAVRNNPNNADAAYFAGYASYQAGKKTEAIRLFWYVAKNCPTSKRAFAAREILRKIDPEYAKHTQDALIGTLPPPARPVTVAPRPAPSADDKKKLIEWIVEKTPRRSNRPDVTSDFLDEIKEGLSSFPYPVLKFLQKNNCHVIVAPCVVEADFRMQGYCPGGYWEGATMEDVPALFDFHNIVVGQYLPNTTSGGYIRNTGILGTLRHEIGHAIDHFSGGLSSKEDFAHARVWDIPSTRHQKALAYFLGGKRGDAEAFAELCAYKFGGRTDKRRDETCKLLKQTSDRSYPLVEKIIEKLESDTGH